jgi:hypothetical protein
MKTENLEGYAFTAEGDTSLFSLIPTKGNNRIRQ